jgi:hypothetical protein
MLLKAKSLGDLDFANYPPLLTRTRPSELCVRVAIVL